MIGVGDDLSGGGGGGLSTKQGVGSLGSVQLSPLGSVKVIGLFSA
jgi:hypothetical protein